MSDLLQPVRDGGLLAPGRPVLVLLSGGRDSVCLLDLAVRIAGAGAVAALHCDYGLRAGSAADARHCAALCAALGVELHVRRPRRDAGAGNLQAWARDARYAAAAELAGGSDVAAGHTASDQVETVLYRLAASPGRRALLGMAAREGQLVRPLLGVTQLGAHLRVLVHHREDPVDDRPELAGGLERDAHRAQEPEVVPPAPEDVLPPDEVVPPPDDEDRLRVEREAAGLRAAVERVAVERDDVEREREAAGFFAAVERDAAGFAAPERDDEDRDAAGLAEDARELVDELAVAERDAAGLRAAGLRAAGLRAAGLAVESPPTSSAETRFARPSTSVRRPLISERTRSSSTSRIRFAATAMSPDSFSAAPAVPAKVRSTALRTASTASTAPGPAFASAFFLSFLSFFAMAERS